jgi:uncharacterized protein (TIGR02588 family)
MEQQERPKNEIAERARARQESEIPPLEWIVGGLGLALVTAIILFLLYQAFAGNQAPPEVRLRVESIEQSGSTYRVDLKVVNEGGTTAEGLVLEGELKKGDQQVERSFTTIEFLPPGSEKKVGLFFRHDPRELALEIRPLGYEDP